MSKNLDCERSVTANKMYPMDLAPQKITIVKSVTNSDVKMAHLIPGQPKTSGTGQIITHTGPVGLMRPAAQILSPGVTSQPQMIVSGTVPILQGTQIVSQGSQLLGQTSQLISQSQLIGSGGQILSPGTQIISQGSQLSAQVSSSNSSGVNSVQVSVPSSITGSQVLNVGGLVSGAGNLVVSSSVRTLPPSVRVLPPLPHHNTRPASLSTVNVSSPSVLVSKSVSHVPRGLAAGASLAVRPVQSTMQSSQAQGPAHYNESAWSGRGARGSLVFGARAAARPAPRAARAPAPPAAAPPLSAVQTIQTPMQHASIVTLPTTVLTTTGVISSSIRPAAAAPRPLPLLQRNYQQTKVVGVNPAARSTTPVGNSAPAQLYYEVPRAPPPAPPPATPPATPPAAPPAAASHAAQLLLPTAHALASLAPVCSAPPASHAAQLLLPTAHALASLAPGAVSNQSANSGPMSEMRQTAAPVSLTQPRPTILRKRDSDGSPTKSVGVETSYSRPGWEGVPWGQLTDHEDVNNANSGGSTTMSASSSPTREPSPADTDASPRKKPRKQMLSNEVRQCDYQPDESPPSPPPVNIIPPKRPQLSASYQCGWRATALHFTRPADVRRRAPRPADILQIAARRHVLASADGWRVHHLTAQMDALVSLEADVGEQLKSVLRALETASGRALSALQPHSHALLELLKGNIQRSTIVCEGIQEARGDILRVFKHRNFVSDILTRQADKRCFRKHRSQS